MTVQWLCWPADRQRVVKKYVLFLWGMRLWRQKKGHNSTGRVVSMRPAAKRQRGSRGLRPQLAWLSGSSLGLWVAAAFAGFTGGALSLGSVPKAEPRYSEAIYFCAAVDGDTLRCGYERVRLVGIDTPELPGHCQSGRLCAPGDPYAATESLRRALSSRMQIERLGQDHYGRTIAAVKGPKGDLSCIQLERGHALYKPGWDDEGRVVRTCPRSLQ